MITFLFKRSPVMISRSKTAVMMMVAGAGAAVDVVSMGRPKVQTTFLVRAHASGGVFIYVFI